MKLSDAIRRASELSEAINTYWLRESPKRHPRYPLIYPGEEPPPPPPEEAELEAFLRSLPLEQLHLLVAIADVGAVFSRAKRFEATLADACRQYPETEWAVNRLVSQGLLHDYFADGLGALARAGVDAESHQLAHA